MLCLMRSWGYILLARDDEMCMVSVCETPELKLKMANMRGKLTVWKATHETMKEDEKSGQPAGPEMMTGGLE